MNKYKQLVGNSVIFALGNLGSKLMQFIMIPLYSYTLTTGQYGKVDLLTTIVGLLMPVFSLDIYDAVFRYSLDRDDNQRQTFTTGLGFTLAVSGVTLLLALGLHRWVPNYPIWGAEYVLVASMIFSLVSNYARAIERVREFALAGIINSFVMGGLNAWLLLGLHWKMNGYLVSMATGMVVATIYLILVCRLDREVNFRWFHWGKCKEMLRYSIPLVPNLLAWWLNSASDRVFILAMMGASANGIYAMATKIPNILSTLMNIFQQSWQISVVQEYGGTEGKQFITNVFQMFNTLMFMGAILIVAFIKPIFKLLVSANYYPGWQLAPILILAIVYSNLAGFLGTIYTATKKTVPIMYTTVVGAIVNVGLTIVLIPTLRLSGAALANVVSFGIVTVLRMRDVLHGGQLKIEPSYLLLLHGLFLFVGVMNYISGMMLPAVVGILVIVGMMAFDHHTKWLWWGSIELLKRRH